jgi:hypothetical protein
VVLLIAALAWQFVPSRRRREFQCNSPARLFGELCRSHHVDRSTRRLLKQLAVVRGLNDPSVLFVEPDCFDVTSLPSSLTGSAAELRRLRHKLFD